MRLLAALAACVAVVATVGFGASAAGAVPASAPLSSTSISSTVSASTAASSIRSAASTTTTTEPVTLAPAQFGDLRSGQPLRLFLNLQDLTGAGIDAGAVAVSIDRAPVASRSALSKWFAGSTRASVANVTVGTSVLPTVAPARVKR